MTDVSQVCERNGCSTYLVERALLGLLHSRAKPSATAFNTPFQHPLDLLEYTVILGDTHGEKFLGTVILVQDVVGVFPQLLHVRANEHLSQLDEITVILVIDFDCAPRVSTPTDLTAVRGVDDVVASNDSKRDLALQSVSLARWEGRATYRDFLVLLYCLLILVLIHWRAEDPDLMMVDVVQDLGGRSQNSLAIHTKRTRRLKRMTSSSVNVSDLAMTGIRLTLVCRRFMNSTSIGFSLSS